MRGSDCGRHSTGGARGLAIFLATSFFAGAATAAAQTAPPVRGDSVQVTIAGKAGIYEFREVRGDTLMIASGGTVWTVPLATVDRLEVGTREQTSRGGRALRAAGWGLLVGAGTGAVMGYASGGSGENCSMVCLSREETALLAAGTFGVVGGGLGLLLGGLGSPGWRWEAVDVDRLTVEVGPAGGSGIGLGVTWHP